MSVQVAHELGRKLISLHLDDEAALKRDVILNQFRLTQRLSLIGGFNVIRAMGVVWIGRMEW